MGARIAKMRGISNEVIFIKMEIEMPSEAIKSRNRKDCDNHMIDIKEKLTSKKPISAANRSVTANANADVHSR